MGDQKDTQARRRSNVALFLERGHSKTATVLAVLEALRPYAIPIALVVTGSPYLRLLMGSQ